MIAGIVRGLRERDRLQERREQHDDARLHRGRNGLRREDRRDQHQTPNARCEQHEGLRRAGGEEVESLGGTREREGEQRGTASYEIRLGRERNSSVVYFTSSWIIHGSARRNTTRDTDELRNEGERLFLDLRDRLQHADGEPDEQRDDQHRPGDEQGEHDGVAGEIDDEGVGHLAEARDETLNNQRPAIDQHEQQQLERQRDHRRREHEHAHAHQHR